MINRLLATILAAINALLAIAIILAGGAAGPCLCVVRGHRGRGRAWRSDWFVGLLAAVMVLRPAGRAAGYSRRTAGTGNPDPAQSGACDDTVAVAAVRPDRSMSLCAAVQSGAWRLALSVAQIAFTEAPCPTFPPPIVTKPPRPIAAAARAGWICRRCRSAYGRISAGTTCSRSGARSCAGPFDLGVTHFDLANNYGPPIGSAEENFGRVMATDFKAHRDELVVSTKAGWDMWPGPYGGGGGIGGGRASTSLASPGSKPEAHGPGLCRHLLFSPRRSDDAAGGDDGRADPGAPAGQGALCRAVVLFAGADPPRL